MSNVSEARVSDDLVELTRTLSEAGWEPSSGGLGGEFGYGADFENDTFEMHPFWWGDCECGYEEREMEWSDANKHADRCYQTALARELDDDKIGYGDPKWDEILERLCAKFGLDPKFGSMVHCTCSHDTDYATWRKANDHDPKCGVARPNFLHKPTGVRVDWYKYIGRGMEMGTVDRKDWSKLIQECVDSIQRNPDYVKPEPVKPMTAEEERKWADENIYVYSGSLPEVLQQIDETMRPVAVIESMTTDRPEF